MVRLVVAVGTTVIVVAFGLMNTHHVQVSPVFGEPITIRMVFLLALVFTAGLVCASMYQMVVRIRQRRVRRSGAFEPSSIDTEGE